MFDISGILFCVIIILGIKEGVLLFAMEITKVIGNKLTDPAFYFAQIFENKFA